MSKVSIREIQTEWKEPRRTQMLRALVDGGVAVSIVYKPNPACSPHRKDFVDVEYGKRRVRFLAGKPQSVSVGLASHIFDQFKPLATNCKVVAWFDGEWEEVDDGIDTDSVGPLPSATIAAPESALSHLAPLGDRPAAGGRESSTGQRPSGNLPKVPAPHEEDVDMGASNEGSTPPRADAVRPPAAPPPKKPVVAPAGARPLHALNKVELSVLHEQTVGPVPEGASRSAILSAVKAARDAGE